MSKYLSDFTMTVVLVVILACMVYVARKAPTPASPAGDPDVPVPGVVTARRVELVSPDGKNKVIIEASDRGAFVTVSGPDRRRLVICPHGFSEYQD
jgi:hypothetical protein